VGGESVCDYKGKKERFQKDTDRHAGIYKAKKKIELGRAQSKGFGSMEKVKGRARDAMLSSRFFNFLGTYFKIQQNLGRSQWNYYGGLGGGGKRGIKEMARS